MARRNQDINPLLVELKNSLTEEDILKHLIELVKKFDPIQYKEVIYDNPYYKSLIPDIQSAIKSELDKISKSIQTEIQGIETELKKVSITEAKELKKLKRDCLALIYEIDERKKEIDSLSQ
jgi:mRNA-degrading endonuclease RelE of RelBE toxin-antitoxin system